MTKKFPLEKIIYWLLLALTVYVLLAPPPLAIIPIDLVKRFGFAIIATLGVILWLLSVLQSGRLVIPKSLILGSLGLVGLTSLVSAFLSNDVRTALLGSALEMTTAWITLLLVLLAFLVAQIFNTKERITAWYGMFIIGAFLVSLFQVVHIFIPSLVGWVPLAEPAANLIGSWSDLALMFGFAGVSLLLILELVDLSEWRQGKRYLSIASLVIFLGLLFTATTTIWVLLAILALILFVWPFIARVKPPKVLRPASIVLAVSFVVLILSFSQSVWPRFLNYLYTSRNIVTAEIRPSFNASVNIAKATFKTKPILGSGPNTFFSQWTLYKPADPAAGNLLDLDFDSAYSFILTSLVQLGFVGAVFWLVFFLLVLWSGWQMWQRPPPEPVTKALAAVVYGGVLYWWVLALWAVPGPSGMVLMFLVTGLWVGLLLNLKRVKLVTVTFNQSRVWGGLAVVGLVILILFGLFTFYGLGIRTYGWLAYAQVISRLQNGETPPVALDNLAKIRSVYSNEIFDRIVVSLTTGEIKALANDTTSTPDQLRSTFSNLVNSGVAVAQEAIREHPTNYNNWLVLGSVYETLIPFGVADAATAATQAYTEALSRNPQSTSAYVSLARVALANKAPDQAKSYLSKVLTIQPVSVSAILLLAQVDANQGKTDEAVKQLEQAVVVIPNDGRLWFALGYLRYQGRHYQEAEAALVQAVRLSPSLPENHYFLGLAYDANNKLNEAIEEFTLLSQADPGNEAYKIILANIRAGRPALSTK